MKAKKAARTLTSLRSLSDLFLVLEATSHVASLSRLMEHFRSRFWGLASLSLNLMMETDDDVDVDESVDISDALSTTIFVTAALDRLPAQATVVSTAPTYKTSCINTCMT